MFISALSRALATCALMGLTIASNARADYYVPANAIPMPPAQSASDIATKLANEINGKVVRIANTGSMAPTITAGDLVVYAPLDFKLIKTGDIIFFEAEMDGARFTQISLFAHRVVCVDKLHRVWTKGDANRKWDLYPVWKVEFKGRASYIVNGQTGEVRDLRDQIYVAMLGLN